MCTAAAVTCDYRVCKVIEIMLLQTSKLTRITCVFSVSGCLCVHLLSCYHCSCFQTTCGSFWVLVTEWFHCPVKRKRIKKKLYCSFFIVGARSALCITAADYWTVISSLNLTGCWRHTSNKLTEKDRFTRNKQDKEPHLYLFYQFSLQIKVTFYITVKQ